MLRIIPIKPNRIRQGTPEPQGGGAVLDKLITQIVTRQQLLVRSGTDELVNERVPTRVECGGVPDTRAVKRMGVEHGAVWEGLADGARLEVGRGVGKVLAARDRDGAQPVLVGGGAVVAAARERVALAGRRLARNLRERFVEVGVDRCRVVVIEGRELGRVAEARVARDRVSDLVAEVEVNDEGAVAVV